MSDPWAAYPLANQAGASDPWAAFPLAPKEEGRGATALSFVDNVVRQIANGVTFGLADEFAAGANTVLPMTPEARGSYEANLATERGKDAAFQAENPGTALTAQLAGGLMTGGAGAARVAGAKALSSVPSVVRYAGAGAAGGGLAGFGSGEGGFENRMEGAGSGALLGTAVGAVGPYAVGLAGKVLSPITDRLRPGSTAQEKLAEALERDGLTPQQIEQRLAELGPEAAIVDAGGENVRGLGRAVAGVPGEGKNRATEFMTARQEGQGARVAGQVDSALGNGQTYLGSAEELIALREAAARPLYQRVVVPENLIPEQQFAPLAADPFVARLIQDVKGDPLFGMAALPDNALPVIDAAKKRLDDMIGAARRSGENNRVRLLTERKERMLAAADEAFPEYAEARAAFAGPSQSLDALEMGRNFIKSDAEVTARDLAKLSDGDKEFFRAGAAQQLRDMIFKAGDGANAVRRIFGNEMIRGKIRAIFPSDEAFDSFRRAMEAEAEMYSTRAAVTQGSRTTPMALEVQDMTGEAIAAGLDAASGSPAGIFRGGSMLWERLKAPPEPVADRLAAMLFESNPNQNAQVLASLLRNPVPGARTGGNRAALASALGGTGGQNLAPR